MAVFKVKDKTKDGRQWVFKVYYDDIDGIRKSYKSKKYLTNREAKEEEAKFILNTNNIEKNKSMTLEACSKLYLNHIENKVKSSSYLTYENKINAKILAYFKNALVNKIGYDNVNKWIKELKAKQLKTSYINDLITLLKKLLKFARNYYNINVINVDLIEHIKSDREEIKEMSFLTIDEFNRFLEKVDNQVFNVLFTTLFFMGMRRGELLALNWKDFNGSNITIDKTINFRTKSGKYELTDPKSKNAFRTIGCPDIVIEKLNKLKNYYRKFEGFQESWFVFGGIRPTSRTTLRTKLNQYIKTAFPDGDKYIRVHDFRHSSVAYLFSLGIDEKYIAQRIGDTVEMVRDVYSHLYPQKILEVVSLMNENIKI